MSTIPMPTAETPLLSPLEKEFPKSLIYSGSSTKPNTYNNNSSIDVNDHELHFYNPATILDLSREVAFAYLILLTGGDVDYVAPTSLVEIEAGMAKSFSSAKQQPQSINQPDSPLSSIRSTTIQEDSRKQIMTTHNFDDETASLAYSAIVDGNVLHACFGQKITPNGRVSNKSAGSKLMDGDASRSSGGETNPPQLSSPYSFFCCFPRGGSASSPTLDVLHLVLSNLSSDRTKMQHLAEILKEVREMHLESSLGGEDCAVGAGVLSTSNSTKLPLHLQVVRAYIHCFASIVRYHDAKEIILCSHGEGNRKNIMKKRTSNIICTNFLKKIHILSRNKSNTTNPRLEQLRTDTLYDIGKGFHGLKEDIWESLERVATETSFTGCASLEESTLGGSIKSCSRGVDRLP